jgi:signal transduction histidine kinase
VVIAGDSNGSDYLAYLARDLRERQQVEKLKEAFISNVSHELRTPLSIALFQMQDLLESQKKSPKTIHELNVAYTSLENLKNMIQKMFNVQQYDLNKVSIQKEKIDINTRVKTLDAELRQDPKYLEKLNLEALRMRKGKELKEIDSDMVNRQLAILS